MSDDHGPEAERGIECGEIAESRPTLERVEGPTLKSLKMVRDPDGVEHTADAVQRLANVSDKGLTGTRLHPPWSRRYEQSKLRAWHGGFLHDEARERSAVDIGCTCVGLLYAMLSMGMGSMDLALGPRPHISILPQSSVDLWRVYADGMTESEEETMTKNSEGDKGVK